MTIMGLQSFDRFRAKRRFNATHGWAPGFDKSRSDSHENIGNQQRSHLYNRLKGPGQLTKATGMAGFCTRSEDNVAKGRSESTVIMQSTAMVPNVLTSG